MKVGVLELAKQLDMSRRPVAWRGIAETASIASKNSMRH